MKAIKTLRPFKMHRAAIALLGFPLAACTPAEDPRPAPRPAASPPGEVVVFASSEGARARVTRVASLDGGETLHGETELWLGATTRRCIIEDVRLDPRGRLLQADLSTAASCDAEPEVRAHLEPARGIVTTRAGVQDPIPPSAAPWIYTPEALPGRAVTTPVAAWVALRAAASSPWLTLVQLERGRVWRVPSEQVVVPTERGTTVVLGHDGAEVGAGFVERVSMTDDGVTLLRTPCRGEPAI